MRAAATLVEMIVIALVFYNTGRNGFSGANVYGLVVCGFFAGAIFIVGYLEDKYKL